MIRTRSLLLSTVAMLSIVTAAAEPAYQEISPERARVLNCASPEVMAALAEKFAPVRSITTPTGNHGTGCSTTITKAANGYPTFTYNYNWAVTSSDRIVIADTRDIAKSGSAYGAAMMDAYRKYGGGVPTPAPAPVAPVVPPRGDRAWMLNCGSPEVRGAVAEDLRHPWGGTYSILSTTVKGNECVAHVSGNESGITFDYAYNWTIQSNGVVEIVGGHSVEGSPAAPPGGWRESAGWRLRWES